MRVRVAEGKYSIELFKKGGEGAGLEEILDRHDDKDWGLSLVVKLPL